MHVMLISTIIVIGQPDNITVCEGEGAVFSCVLNTTNTNISNDDVQWYRFTNDATATEKINQDGASLTITINRSKNVLNGTLKINNVTKSYTGYYWVGTPSDNVCNVSLTVTSSM